MTCQHPRVPAARITRETMARLDLRGTCLQCWIIREGLTCWQHAESDSVFLSSAFEQQFAYECDEITTTQFFSRITSGWSYDLLD